MTAQDHERLKLRMLEPSPIAAWLRNTARLSNLRDHVRFWLVDDRTTLYGCGPDQLRQVEALTQEMQRIAATRGMFFKVVLLPDRSDVIRGEHPALVRAYADGLRNAGIDVVDALPVLTPDDYFQIDPHTNADGARKIAQVIVDALED